jgi:SSS family solute:Na+ symporter
MTTTRGFVAGWRACRRAWQRAWASALAVTALLGLLTGAAQAANLVGVRALSLPALPVPDVVSALAVVDGRPVAFTAAQAWVLAADERSWSATAWPDGPAVQGMAGNGKQAMLLLGRGGTVDRVARLTLVDGRLLATPLPALPTPLRQAHGSLAGTTLYLAGLDSGGAARLMRIDAAAVTPAWSALAGWPGGGAVDTLVAQSKAVFVTQADPSSGNDRLWRWSADAGWTAKPPVPGHALAGSGRATGQAHILYLVTPAGNAADAKPALMSWHTITGSWATQSTTDAAEPRAIAAWKDGLLWLQGGGFRSLQIESGKLLLKWLDWIVIVVYLVSMLGIGLHFYLREKRNSTSDFFVGGRSIPFWAAGVSLYAANTSSISYIAIPAKAFETNWQYLTNNLVAVIGLMFVAVWIVPVLRRLDLMSVFSYLEKRFHPAIRMLSSGLCILVQLGSRMSVILFLPSLAIATITGIDVVWSVLMMGGFTIVYTAMGGMKAVVWTDVVQLVVKMGGALFAIGFMIYGLKGGFSEFVSVAAAEDKTRLFDFSFDLTKATVWGFIFLVLFDVVLTFPKDQVLMQRTLSTKSDKDAGRSIWTFALIMIPGGFVFYTIGTALFVYYKAHPERMNPLLSIDATFPLFIAAELPMGITGLIIAGIFAAAMATLSSIMNSVSTLASVDFYEKLVKHPTPRKSVIFAEVMTVLAGLIGIAFALVLSRYDIHSLFDVSIELAGLLGGGFAGAYTLGMFTRRANSPGVAIGVASAIVLTTLAWTMNLVHPYFYLAISIMLCIVIGYLASLFFPAPTRSLKGLTIYTDHD